MSSTFETGHAKNVSNFEQIITALRALGALYNPSNTLLSIASLENLCTAARNSLDSINDQLAIYAINVDSRKILFKEARTKAKRIMAAVKSSGTNSENIENVAAHYRKITETKTKESKKPPTTEGGSSTETVEQGISTSQKSFSQLAEHFDRLVSVVALLPEYQPNELSLQVPTLKKFRDDLISINQTMMTTLNTLHTKRYDRNQLLYQEKIGIYDTVKSIKNYLKSILENSDERYKKINKISIKNL